jgi:hypothetical protein
MFVLSPTILSFDDRDTWVLQHRFKLVNNSSYDMKLKVQGTTCGCTATEIENPRLEIGETANLEIVVAVPYDRAFRTETVFVETGSPNEILSFTLCGDVFPAISIKPFQRQLFFSELGSVGFDVVVYSKKGQDVDLLEIEKSSDSIKIQFADPEIKDMGSIVRRTFPVKVEVVSEFLNESNITFKSGRNSFPVSVFFHSEPDVTVKPCEILFPRMLHDQNPSEKILIDLVGKTSFNVLEVVCDRELVEATVHTDGSNLGLLLWIGHGKTRAIRLDDVDWSQEWDESEELRVLGLRIHPGQALSVAWASPSNRKVLQEPEVLCLMVNANCDHCRRLVAQLAETNLLGQWKELVVVDFNRHIMGTSEEVRSRFEADIVKLEARNLGIRRLKAGRPFAIQMVAPALIKLKNGIVESIVTDFEDIKYSLVKEINHDYPSNELKNQE